MLPPTGSLHFAAGRDRHIFLLNGTHTSCRQSGSPVPPPAAGFNRDGLALRAANYMLSDTPYEHRLLITLSDCSPNDVRKICDEQGRRLTPEAVWAYDPLHVAALTVKRFNSPTLSSVPNFITERFPHFFKVKAADADTDLTITVCDEFGHEWTEQMERPKAFSTDAYLR